MTELTGEKERQKNEKYLSDLKKLRNESFIAIRNYLKAVGWKDFDEEFLTNNMGFVIDPLTEQNFPIDHAYTIQCSRDVYELWSHQK